MIFRPNRLEIRFGNVLAKSIKTPNEFVSHMVEHIAWRLGASIDLEWHSDDWSALGLELGREIKQLALPKQKEAAVIGMIDDGSAEVLLQMDQPPVVTFETVGDVELAHFRSLRCEQLTSGLPLVGLLEGLTEGLGAGLTVRVCSLEDAHHTWEGVFRAVGIALSRVFRRDVVVSFKEDAEREPSERVASASATTVRQGAGLLRIIATSKDTYRLTRETAESSVSLSVAATGQSSCEVEIAVSPTIDVSEFPGLLALFSHAAGLKIDLKFSATNLSSSHVVLEDTALLLGAALFRIMEDRMERSGINGAGSSLKTTTDYRNALVSAAISVEGRKFLKLVPFDMTYKEFRQRVILGKNVGKTLRSEDVDDFLDALAGGMRASIMVHFRKCRDTSPDELWQGAISAVGEAVGEALLPNSLRRGLPPGVKATLL